MDAAKREALAFKQAGEMKKAVEAMKRFKNHEAEVEKYQEALVLYQ